MESIRQYAKGNAVRDRGKRVSIVRRKREKCDRCSSFLTVTIPINSFTEWVELVMGWTKHGQFEVIVRFTLIGGARAARRGRSTGPWP